MLRSVLPVRNASSHISLAPRAASKLATLLLASVIAGCSSGGGVTSTPTPTPTPVTPSIHVQPMATVNQSAGTGYYSGPYPVRLAAANATVSPYTFSGTTMAILSCPGPVTPGCFTQTAAISVDRGPLAAQAQAAGSSIGGFENNNIFQDDSGNWQMVTTFFVNNPAYPAQSPWNVVVHAHPTAQSSTVPTSWVCDTVLVGSLAVAAPANYDGKYFIDNGQLYLLYSTRVTVSPETDGVVAQRMVSPTQLDNSAPVNMIVPTLTNNGYNSENKQVSGGSLKLLETGNVTKINGKYAIIYSAGTYIEPNYKTGIAWSDTFLPTGTTGYTKITQLDSSGLWGQANHDEVLYLLQAQVSGWPNYVAAQVLAPGVASMAQASNGIWYLYFNGLDPNDAAIDPTTGMYVKNIRRVYYIPLTVNVPTSGTVGGTSNSSLATWISPLT